MGLRSEDKRYGTGNGSGGAIAGANLDSVSTSLPLDRFRKVVFFDLRNPPCGRAPANDVSHIGSRQTALGQKRLPFCWSRI